MANKPNRKPQQPITRTSPATATVKAPAPAPSKPKATTPIVYSNKMLCIALMILSFVVYFNTLWNGYVMDDVIVVKENTIVQQGISAIPELFSTPHMRGYMVIPNDLYRPLSLVMFAIEYQFFGLNPIANHFFNILTFAGCVIMLFLFLDKFFDKSRTALAFVAAAIFAVHPIHTEIVANIKSRDELLSYFFAFWALNLFLNYMKGGKMLNLLAGVFTLFLAAISKETVFTFAAIIPFIFFFHANNDKKRAITITIGSAVAYAATLVIGYMVLTAYDANQHSTAVEFIDNALSKTDLSAASRFATKVVIMGKYLGLMFIPYPLLCTYSYEAIPFSDFADYKVWLTLLAYGFMFYVAVTRFIKDKKDPWAFAIVMYIVPLSLFSNFPFLMGAELAERFAFFASTGFCIAAALAIEKWILKAPASDIMLVKTPKVLAILVPLLVVFGGMTVARNADWKDDYTLYKADVEKSPRDCRLHHNLATALAENMYPAEPDSNKKKLMDKESLEHLYKAMEIYPDYADAHVEMGRVYDRMKMYDSAIRHDLRALQLNPSNATATNNLGSVYLTSGNYPESIVYFKKALELNPNFKYSYINMARAYGALKKYDSSMMNFRQYMVLDPGNIDVKLEIGTAFFMLQRYDSAEHYFKIVLAAKPDESNAINNLGAIYLNTQQYAKAAEFFKKAVTLNPQHFNAFSNLGRSYYFSGQYQLAIDAINQELALNQQVGSRDIPYIALSYQKMGKMDEARKYEAIAKQIFSNFKLD